MFMFTYHGRVVTGKDIVFINELIAQNPGDSRWRLSKKLCQAWNRVQPNGALRDMICRGLMLGLYRLGHIRLPEKRAPPNPFVDREKPEKIKIDQNPLETKLSEIWPLEFFRVRRSSHEKLFNSLIKQLAAFANFFLRYAHLPKERSLLPAGRCRQVRLLTRRI